MSHLVIYNEEGSVLELIKEHETISKRLAALGVRFERWKADKELSWDAGQEEVIKAYEKDINRIIKEFGFKSLDVVSLTPENPKKDELRNMFLKRAHAL
jgi:acireductone dioxygenase apoprotein